MIGIEEDSVRFAHSGPSQRFLRGLRLLVTVGSLFPCPRVDTPPQSLSSSLQKTQYENTAILLIIKEGGGRVSLDGVAARGLVKEGPATQSWEG